jgi:hypothetical protein
MSDAFQRSWGVVKYEIPSIYGGRQNKRPDIASTETMSFVVDDAYKAPGYFEPPNRRKGIPWRSAINVKPIISRVTGVMPNEKFDRELSDREIEDIIHESSIIGLHEGTHIALHPIIEEILDEYQGDDDTRQDKRFAYPYYQEFGAHTASSDFLNRLESPKQSREASRESSKFQRNKHMIQEFPRKRMEEGYTYDEAMADNHPDWHEDSRRYHLRDIQQAQRRKLR